MTEGAKFSSLFDTSTGNVYRVNKAGLRVIKAGLEGATVGEVVATDPDAAEFLNEMAQLGLIEFLDSPPKREEPPCPPEPRLKFAWLEVTSRCNLRCVHCYEEAGDVEREEMSTGEWENIISQLAAMGCSAMQFTGGEPLLRDDVLDLMEHAKAKGVETLEIFTNATLMNEDVAKGLARLGALAAVSLYSYRPETHDKVTRVRGSFERTLRGIKLLKAHRVPVRVSVIAMSVNEKDIPGTMKFLKELGVSFRPPDPVRPSGRGRRRDLEPKKYGKSFVMRSPMFWATKETFALSTRWNPCWFGKAAIASNGDVMPCVFARELVVGNVREKLVKEVVLGDAMLELWGLNKDKIEVCRDCEYRYLCHDCRPLAYGYTGNLYAKTARCAYNPYTGTWEEGPARSRKTQTCPGQPGCS